MVVLEAKGLCSREALDVATDPEYQVRVCHTHNQLVSSTAANPVTAVHTNGEVQERSGVGRPQMKTGPHSVTSFMIGVRHEWLQPWSSV